MPRFTLHEIQKQFAVPGVSFQPGQGNLPCIALKTPECTGEVYLHGAHVTRYAPTNQREVLFVSGKSHFEHGKPIRGGVPVIFPWFGPKANDPSAPMHGIARLAEWDIRSVQATAAGVEIELYLRSSPATFAAFSGGFELFYRVTFGPTLKLSLTIKNPLDHPLACEAALHSYFSVSDVRNVAVTGLEDTAYISKVEGMQRKTQGPGPLKIVGETDRVYQNTTATCVVDDPGYQRKIRIAKRGSCSTVVWNPWIDKAKAMPDFGDDEWPEMICVETCNVGENAMQIAGGAEHRMEAEILVEAK